jgi:hypothetical protein
MLPSFGQKLVISGEQHVGGNCGNWGQVFIFGVSPI